MTKEVADDLGIEATFDHVTDINKIMAYPVLTTPALVINEEVKVAGRMPTNEEIGLWLGKH